MAGQNEEASGALWWVGSAEGVLPSVSPAGSSQLSPEELRPRGFHRCNTQSLSLRIPPSPSLEKRSITLSCRPRDLEVSPRTQAGCVLRSG